MNIFVLDANPIKAAKMHCDKHTNKMLLESAQVMSTAVRLCNGDFGYKACYHNHPANIWARKTRSNFLWLKQLATALCEEYTYRYRKVHASTELILSAPEEYIPNGPLTPFAQAMPDEYKDANAVKAYRNYYIGAKKHLLTYTRRRPPEWLENIAVYKDK